MKMFLCGPDKQLLCFALCLNCRELRIIVGLFTGHIAFNRHLTVITDPQCPVCGEEGETMYHFVGICCANILVRCSIMGAYLMQCESLSKVKLLYGSQELLRG